MKKTSLLISSQTFFFFSFFTAFAQNGPLEDPSWGWYWSRSTGLIGFFLLYISIFLGAVSGIPKIQKYFLRLCSLRGHCWISLQALIFALIHPTSLIFDRYLNFSFSEIFIPFFAPKYTFEIALGQIGLLLIILLVVGSYLIHFLPRSIWRLIHFLNTFLYGAVFFHALLLGSDLKSILNRTIFIGLNILLAFLLGMNIYFRIKKNLNSGFSPSESNQTNICKTLDDKKYN